MAKKNKIKPEDEFDFFDIDRNRLDEEWINQPRLFFKYASQLAEAQRKESEARAKREVIKADCALKVRKNPTKYVGDVKLTEAVIFGVVMKMKAYKEAQSFRLKKQYKTSILQAAVTALTHRRSALERLVSLHGQQYFATPQARDDISKDTVEDMKKRAIRKGKKRKKK